MKKFILSQTLFISGLIGSMILLITSLIVHPNAEAGSINNPIYGWRASVSLTRLTIPLILFVIMTIFGLVYSIKNSKEK